MEYRDFTREIMNNKLDGIYLIYGRETYLMDSSINRIKKNMNSAMIDFNLSVLNGEEVGIRELINNIETLPFMDEKKIVIVENLEIFKGKRKNFSESDEKYLIQALENIPETTVLIFMLDTDPDKRKSLFKTIKKNGNIIDVNKISDIDLFQWVRNKFAQHSVKIENSQIMYFIDVKGYRDKNSDLRLNDLENEIEKIAMFLGRDSVVTNEAIDEMTMKKSENDLFRFIDSIVKKDANSAILIFEDMVNDGESILGIYAMLGREFKILLQMKSIKKKGIKPEQAAKLLNIHPFTAKKAYRQSDSIEEGVVKSVVKYISDADYRIKNGLIDPRLSMEILIANFCGNY